MMNIAHQLVMMADSTSENWYELVGDASDGGCGVIYRSIIIAPPMCLHIGGELSARRLDPGGAMGLT